MKRPQVEGAVKQDVILCEGVLTAAVWHISAVAFGVHR